MYPTTYFGLFPAYPRDDRVFVAMSFDGRFRQRFESVIALAIRDVGFDPYRVDQSVIGDSILVDILHGICNAQLVLGDVTTLFLGPDQSPVRNANVMYELGIAHATRQPEEVLLFRSDTDRLLFDVAHIRVNPYDPDGNPGAARDLISKAIVDALAVVDKTRSLAVGRAARALDVFACSALTEVGGAWEVAKELGITSGHPVARKIGNSREQCRGVAGSCASPRARAGGDRVSRCVANVGRDA